jgi:hypothetical protein
MNSWISIFQALLTPTIGVVAAFVAWQQYRLAKQKHDIDIFNRRMHVYKTTIAFLVKAEGRYSISEGEYYEWLSDVADAEFLFGKEILDLLRNIESASADIILQQRDNPMIKRGKKGEILSLNYELSGLFNDVMSFRGRASLLFAPYFQTFLRLKSLQRESKYKELLEEEKAAHDKYHREHPLPPPSDDDIPF